MYSDAYIMLCGNVIKDPYMGKAKETPVCMFSMAVRTGKRDENGRFQTDIYKISVFNEVTMKYVMEEVKVGARVRLVGWQTLGAYFDEKNSVAEPIAYVTAGDVKIDARPRPKEEQAAS